MPQRHSLRFPVGLGGWVGADNEFVRIASVKNRKSRCQLMYISKYIYIYIVNTLHVLNIITLHKS